jgi:hypothetical protein
MKEDEEEFAAGRADALADGRCGDRAVQPAVVLMVGVWCLPRRMEEVKLAEDVSVLLVKSGGEISALSPRCTHMGANLKNGVRPVPAAVVAHLLRFCSLLRQWRVCVAGVGGRSDSLSVAWRLLQRQDWR